MLKDLDCVFHSSSYNDVLSYVSLRDGEQKIGETIRCFDERKSFKGKFVILGVKEDVGPRANLGVRGADNGFDAFFKRFVNMQSNRFLSGEEVLFWGTIQVENSSQDVSVSKLREYVEVIDEKLFVQLKEIYALNLIPIVIGGGHNNAYSLMKAYYYSFNNPMYVLNVDPHADFRALEGRHSGNSFSYAMEYRYLAKYACVGLHESYNSESMLSRLEENDCWVSFFEDYLFGRKILFDDLSLLVNAHKELPFGFEFDVDSLKFMPSSAFTPSGFSFEEARKIVSFIASNRKCAYLHIPEAAPISDYENKISGKVIAYLVSDFIKANKLLF